MATVVAMDSTQSTPRLPICVYMAARHGARPVYTEAARGLGGALVNHGCDLIYGGGSVGLMGEVADAVLAGGHRVTGIITEHLHEREVGHPELSELVVVPDMQSRKREMFERSAGFIILPGGLGTMEELFEVWCWAVLGLHPKPIGIVNTDSYYDDLLRFLERSIRDDLLSPEALSMIHVSPDPDSVVSSVVGATDSVVAATDNTA